MEILVYFIVVVWSIFGTAGVICLALYLRKWAIKNNKPNFVDNPEILKFWHKMLLIVCLTLCIVGGPITLILGILALLR